MNVCRLKLPTKLNTSHKTLKSSEYKDVLFAVSTIIVHYIHYIYIHNIYNTFLHVNFNYSESMIFLSFDSEGIGLQFIFLRL